MSATEPAFLTPVVAYDFENDVRDGSGNGNDGIWRQTESHPEAYVDGIAGKAMHFERGQSFVSLPVGVQPSQAGMSVSMWVKELEHNSDGALFGNLDFNSRSNPGFLLGHTTSVPQIVAVAGGDGVPHEVIPAEATTEWTHLVVTLDEPSKTMTVYRNGSLSQTTTYSSAKPVATAHPFRLGTDGANVTNNGWGSSWTSGYIDSFRFFDGPISAEQARAEFGRHEISISADEHGTVSSSLATAKPGDTVTLTAQPREGYHLVGWDSPAGVVVTNGSFVMPDFAVKIHARFDANRYELDYNGNGADGGTTAASNHVYDSSAALTPNGFTRAGHSFLGWATTNSGAIAYSDAAQIKNLSAEDGKTITLYARWLADGDHVITVKESEHGTVATALTAKPGTVVTPVATPDEGYHFVDWVVSPTVALSGDAFTMPEADVTVSARFAPNTYSVVYEGNGATSGSTERTNHTYNRGSALASNHFSRNDTLVFAGWNTAANGSGIHYREGVTVHNLTSEHDGVVRLYAQWSAESVTFGANADIHNNWSALGKTFEFWKNKGVDAGVLVGDLTENGTPTEVKGLLDTLATNRGNLDVVSSRGNHDGAVTDNAWLEATGNERNQEIEVNGYHFLLAECTGSQTYSVQTQKFLQERLTAVTTADPNKPVFVLAHCPLPRTVYASVMQGGGYYGSGLGQGDTTSIFDAFPQAVVLSGHIHYPNRIPTAIWQDKGWTAMNVPSEMNGYFGEAPGGAAGTGISGTVDIQTTIVEVVSSLVTVKHYDLTTGKQDGPTWSWDAANPTDRPYTRARADQTLPPTWADSDTAVISDVSASTATATFPAAVIPGPNSVDDVVHHYSWRVSAPGSDTAVESGWVGADWYRHSPSTGMRTVKATGLRSCTEYDFQITAANAWHHEGKPLSTTFFTDGNCAVTIAKSAHGSASADKRTASSGTTVSLTATPEAGYRHVGWTSDRGVTVEEGRFTMAPGPITITPVFAANSYMIAFDANGGEGTYVMPKLGFDEPALLPVGVFARAGYTLAGWATEAGGPVVYSNGATVAELSRDHDATVTLFAVWSATPAAPDEQDRDDTAKPSDTQGEPSVAQHDAGVAGTSSPGDTGNLPFTGGASMTPLLLSGGLLLALGIGSIVIVRARQRSAADGRHSR